MIPKIIHYVWLGNNPIPKFQKKCINSWKTKCPDYKFICWNEDNFDIKKYTYTREAYEEKKFAFVSDFIRLYALLKFGGIYLDTDMKLIKPLDNFLTNTAFCGFEDKEHINCAIIGASKNNIHIKNIFNRFYLNNKFKINGKLNLTTIPSNFTNYFSLIGAVLNDKTQIIRHFKIYKTDYFYPISPDWKKDFTKNTTSIHYWSASWADKKTKKEINKIKYSNKFVIYHLYYKILQKCRNLISKIKNKVK